MPGIHVIKRESNQSPGSDRAGPPERRGQDASNDKWYELLGVYPEEVEWAVEKYGLADNAKYAVVGTGATIPGAVPPMLNAADL